MNERQYNIVKIMQNVGIRAGRFATACHQPAVKIRTAYNSASYNHFVELWREVGGYGDMMDKMGL